MAHAQPGYVYEDGMMMFPSGDDAGLLPFLVPDDAALLDVPSYAEPVILHTVLCSSRRASKLTAEMCRIL